MIMGSAHDTAKINLTGSRNVFDAAVAAGASRLVYASSVAAYGFGPDNPPVLTEDIEPRGTARHYYSAQKAELEGTLREALAGSATEAYVFRPCIVAGPDALTLVETIPYVQVLDKMPSAVLRALDFMPALKPVLPNPGVPFQLVHHDDVATALEAAVVARGEPGIYNLAADGTLTVAELADALGWYSVPVPEVAVGAAAEVVSRLPFLPAEAQWIESLRRSVIMDTSRARTLLGWEPRYDARETLEQMARAARAAGLIR
jgi:nucleoside-diphosphate-sugar epimerase